MRKIVELEALPEGNLDSKRRRWMISQLISISVIGSLVLLAAGSSSHAEDKIKTVQQGIELLRPLHQKLGKPKPGEWLDRHNEQGETFPAYVASKPVVPTHARRTIYIQPIGQFSEAQEQIISLTADFMGLYFSLPVKVRKSLPLSVVPDSARRVHPSWGDKQILTTYVLEEILRKRLPHDAVAFIAFTSSDLWPGMGWNFVFGQASLRDRVGVWSIYRNGDPDSGSDSASNAPSRRPFMSLATCFRCSTPLHTTAT